MGATKNTVPGCQPSEDQFRVKVSEEEYNAAKQIAEYMKRYPYFEAHELYEAIELALKFASDLEKAGIEKEKFWQIIIYAGSIDWAGRWVIKEALGEA